MKDIDNYRKQKDDLKKCINYIHMLFKKKQLLCFFR